MSGPHTFLDPCIVSTLGNCSPTMTRRDLHVMVMAESVDLASNDTAAWISIAGLESSSCVRPVAAAARLERDL